MTDLSILVPVYNERPTIETAMKRLESLEGYSYELLIVDDCSTDGTREYLEEWQASVDGDFATTLLFHERNQGKGAAIRTGLAHATGRFFVVQDADLEYDPAELGALLEATDRSDVVYGSRFLGHMVGMPTANYWANRLYNFLLLVLYGVKMTDMHTCYKMMRTDLLRELDLHSDGFEYATEIISKLLLRHEKVIEVPITFNGRTVAEGKKIGWHDGWECVLKMVQFRFGVWGELARFCLVGAVGFAVNFTMLFLLHGLVGINLIPAQLLSVEAALLTTFALHHNWTYREYDTVPMWRRLVGYQISASVGVAITTAVLWVLATGLEVQYLLSLTIGAAFAFVWNYHVNRRFIWRHAPAAIEAAAVVTSASAS